MKKSTIKILVLSILLIMVLSITLPVLADTENKSIILKTEENEFIVYYEKAYKNEFQFAISEKLIWGLGSIWNFGKSDLGIGAKLQIWES